MSKNSELREIHYIPADLDDIGDKPMTSSSESLVSIANTLKRKHVLNNT